MLDILSKPTRAGSAVHVANPSSPHDLQQRAKPCLWPCFSITSVLKPHATNTPCGTRTHNLRIRGPTPCPLGQGGHVGIAPGAFKTHCADMPRRRAAGREAPCRLRSAAARICWTWPLSDWAGQMILAGLEPAIFGSEDQRLIH